MILFLSGVAGSEILVILLFILIFFGAKSIPGMSRSLGRGIRQIKDASQEIQDEIRKTTGDMRKEMDLNRALNQAVEDVEKPIRKAVGEIERESNEINRAIVSQEYRNKVTPPVPSVSPSKAQDDVSIEPNNDEPTKTLE
jgi:sec-independent protein translocase protein TatA